MRLCFAQHLNLQIPIFSSIISNKRNRCSTSLSGSDISKWYIYFIFDLLFCLVAIISNTFGYYRKCKLKQKKKKAMKTGCLAAPVLKSDDEKFLLCLIKNLCLCTAAPSKSGCFNALADISGLLLKLSKRNGSASHISPPFAESMKTAEGPALPYPGPITPLHFPSATHSGALLSCVCTQHCAFCQRARAYERAR